jgi:hypothetical protein
MASGEQSASQRTSAALALLKPVAKNVSAAANTLSSPIVRVDAELKRMHIAFEAWVTYYESKYDYSYTNWDIGYSRIDGRWGIGLRLVRGDESDPERSSIESWHFNEAPLYLRHRAIEKLPELLEALAKTGEKVAQKLANAATQANEIAEVVAPAAKGKK